MKWIVYSAVLLVVAMMTACSGSKFKVEAEIAGLGNQNVHVVWMGDSGVVDAFIPAQEGKFAVEGSFNEPTVVSILDSHNKPLVRIVASGGDKLKVTGDFNNPHHYRCKGSDVAQEWLDFESEHAALYDMADRTQLDRAIEKYVNEHPSSLVSTLLLVIDYSDSHKAASLLDKVDMKVRSASLCESLERLKAVLNKTDNTLHSMMLCGMNGDFEAVVAAPKGATLIYMWHDNRPERRENVKSMKALSKQWGSRLTIADVSLMPDTLGWRPVVRGDSTSWNHYWAPGSILDPAVEPLHLRDMPVAIVADSTGHIMYRGKDMTAASAALEKYFK